MSRFTPLDWLRKRGVLDRVRSFHRDESGVITLLTVFVMLGCTWMLLWLFNSAKQLDSKVRMQNAVDAAGQSGVGVLARGMNAVAFANRFEADLIAAVAVMQGTQSTPAASSPMIGVLLPTFQEILAGQSGQLPPDRPIPAFRRSIVTQIPMLADEVTRNVGRANGLWRGVNAANNPNGPQGSLLVQLWTTSGQAIGHGSEDDPHTRTLPLIDPSPLGLDAQYLGDSGGLLQQARQEREQLVRHYIAIWARDLAAGDPALASRLISQAEIPLQVLLNDLYSKSNLPLLLRSPATDRQTLERDLMFVSVAYRRHSISSASRMFRNPNAAIAPAMAFAQLHLFLPRPRYICCPWGETRIDPRTGESYFISYTDGWPTDWSAHTQNWQAKLVPATARSLSAILSQSVPGTNANPPHWGQLTPRQFDELTHH